MPKRIRSITIRLTRLSQESIRRFRHRHHCVPLMTTVYNSGYCYDICIVLKRPTEETAMFAGSRGVDSTATSDAALAHAIQLASHQKCVVAVSGKVDYVSGLVVTSSKVVALSMLS